MKIKRLFFILLSGLALTFLFLLLLGGYPHQISFAQSGTGVFRVSTAGTDTPTCGSVATPCRTVQYAIGLASPTDEILVASGIYTDPAGTVAALDKSLTLQGGWNADFSTYDPTLFPTTLDARRMGSVISITGQTDAPITATIDGFIITRGDASSQAVKGGGLYSRYANPTIINNVFTNNIANSVHYFTGDGGGLYLTHSEGVAIIRDNTFISNTAAITGGWGQGGAIYSEYSSPQIIGNVISNNIANGFIAIPGARSIGGNGGGIVVYNGLTNTTVISGNQILNNIGSTGEHGTGGGLTLGRGAMLVQNNTVHGNIACSNGYGSGGGIFLSANAGAVTITDNLVENNNAGTAAVATSNSSSRGGGIFLEYMLAPGPVVVENNTVIGNVAATANIGNGGGIYLRNSEGATTIRNNRILSNTGSIGNWSIGGGLYVSESSVATITGNLIENNVASAALYPQVGAGGGLATQSNHPGVFIHHNTIRNNVAASNGWGEAGGYFSRSDEALIFENNTIENNSGAFNHTAFGGGAYLESSAVALRHNTLQNNAASIVDGHGGGAFVYFSTTTLNANTIISNTSAVSTSATGIGSGGGLTLYASNGITVSNNIIAENRGAKAGSSEGDGVWIRSFDAANTVHGILLHNTIADNGSEGVWIGKYATAALTNNIISGHTMAITNTTPASATLTADHTLFWNDTAVPISGTNALFGDPLFAGNGDYHLLLGSAAIDAGINIGITSDIDGDPRPANGIPDIGADEYFTCDAPLTGASISGIENGDVNTPYVFTSVITPANATEPISYDWSPEPSGGSGTLNLATYQWATPGVYTITLTVTNCGGTVIATRAVTISEHWNIYLPLIMKSVTARMATETPARHPPQTITAAEMQTAAAAQEYEGGALSLLPPHQPEMP